jgi:hypothetical protein
MVGLKQWEQRRAPTREFSFIRVDNCPTIAKHVPAGGFGCVPSLACSGNSCRNPTRDAVFLEIISGEILSNAEVNSVNLHAVTAIPYADGDKSIQEVGIGLSDSFD